MNILDCHDGDPIPFGKTLEVPGTSRCVRILEFGVGEKTIGNIVEAIVEADGTVNEVLTKRCKWEFKFSLATECAMRNLGSWLTDQPACAPGQ